MTQTRRTNKKLITHSVQLKYFLSCALLFLIIMFLSLVSPNTLAKSAGLRIAVSSNFAPVLEKLLVQFTQESFVRTQVISGGTGTLFLQIQHGAPFDIFLAADELRPKALEDKDLIVAGSRETYAIGELAYWSANTPITSLDALKKIPKRFAIANPDIAPYGKAAKEALITLSLWQDYQNVLVQGININQTFQQVRSQAVPAGIVANSQLVLNHLNGYILPKTSYTPIKQQLVILKKSKMKSSAKMLSDFLLRADIQEKITRFGYQEILANSAQKSLLKSAPELTPEENSKEHVTID